ncbi:hypothetical protein, partial [Streptomyces goshikiensis]|uniref:hypothetical protein n=1 Tax=Streptomyces goshikiensis TaxID=1942 RepID=UPI001E5A28A3
MKPLARQTERGVVGHIHAVDVLGAQRPTEEQSMDGVALRWRCAPPLPAASVPKAASFDTTITPWLDSRYAARPNFPLGT